jgi:hypothetical protein
VLLLPGREAVIDHRRRHVLALSSRIGRGRFNGVGELQAAGQDLGAHLSQEELISDVVDGPAGIKSLAGEDVDPDVAVFGEGMDGDVALGDKDEAGDA